MVRAGALLSLLAVFLGGCFEDRYSCRRDADCDVGSDGVCEANGLCTARDLTCDTGRRYAAHSGELSGTCFDDRVEPQNPCAGGQPPAPRTGCYAQVCERMPTCCDLGWTDACVPLAQEECPAVCDTRVAITATRSTTTELWHATWNGTDWTIDRETHFTTPLQWVGPAPNTTAPRLAGSFEGQLYIGESTVGIVAGRTYQSVTSVDFDRDGLDTIAMAYSSSDGNAVEIWKPGDDSLRSADIDQTQLMTWGDQDRDGFPDAVARAGSNYGLLSNLPEDHGLRRLSSAATSAVSGGATPGAPVFRAIDWLDFDGDHRLDLAVFGASVRIHTSSVRLTDTPDWELDCIPPSTTRACSADPEPNLESASFGGTPLPTRDEPSVVLTAFPGRKLYRVRQQGDAVISTPLPFPNDTCSCAQTCTMCPGASCSCTYDCSMCPSVLALTSRDLDGDHLLDLVAIDSKLWIYTAFGKDGLTFSKVNPVPTTFPNPFVTVGISVSGAPR